MTYETVCSRFFEYLDNIYVWITLNNVRESTFLNFATFCDVSGGKNDPN